MIGRLVARQADRVAGASARLAWGCRRAGPAADRGRRRRRRRRPARRQSAGSSPASSASSPWPRGSAPGWSLSGCRSRILRRPCGAGTARRRRRCSSRGRGRSAARARRLRWRQGDRVAVDEDLDGADVAGEVPRVVVGPGQRGGADLCVELRRLWRAVAEPGLQLEQRHRLLGVVELAGDRGAGPVAGDVPADVGGGKRRPCGRASG